MRHCGSKYKERRLKILSGERRNGTVLPVGERLPKKMEWDARARNIGEAKARICTALNLGG